MWTEEKHQLKGISLPIFVIILLVMTISCRRESDSNVVFSYPEKTLSPEITDISFPDSVPLIIGEIISVDNGYWCYVYHNEDCLLATDENLVPKKFFAHKGGGPGEITDVSGPYGEDLGNGLFSVFDSASFEMYGTNSELDYSLKEVITLEKLKQYAVWKVLRMKNGKYVAPKGDFTCGIVEYDPVSDTVTEWPTGFDPAETPATEYQLTELTLIAYNPTQDIVAVVYGMLPNVFLYDSSGKLVRTLTYDGYRLDAAKIEKREECYESLQLTDDHIWLMLDNKDDPEHNSIIVVDYQGNPVMTLKVGGGNNFSVDTERKRLITVDPSKAEAGVTVYRIPEL